MSTTVKASQNNKVIDLFLFPSHKQLGSNVKSRNIRQGRGCHLSSANRELGAGSDAVTAAEEKGKIPQLVLVLLSSQTPRGVASSVLEKLSNTCGWGSCALVTILREGMKPTFQHSKNRPVTSCQVLKEKKRLASELRL